MGNWSGSVIGCEKKQGNSGKRSGNGKGEVRREKKGSGKSSGKATVKDSGWKGQWKGPGQVTTAGGNGSRYRKYRTTVLPIFLPLQRGWT